MKLKYLFTLSLVGLLAVNVAAQKIRIKTGIDIVVNECKRKQVNDATIITHAGVIMAIKNEVSSAPASAFTSLKVDNGKSIILYIDDNQHWMIKE